VSAKLVTNFIEDLTPDEEKAKLDIRDSIGIIHRVRGTGRPTKKERRQIDRIKDQG
jgi:ribosome-associated heat shock protein Hsp15